MRKRLATGLLLAVITLTIVLSLAPSGQAELWRPEKRSEYKETTLTELSVDPESYVGKYVRFDCQYIKSGELYYPYSTIFRKTQYQNFYVWPDNLRLWREDDRRLAHLYVYMSRREKEYEDFQDLDKYDRVTIFGKVQAAAFFLKDIDNTQTLFIVVKAARM